MDNTLQKIKKFNQILTDTPYAIQYRNRLIDTDDKGFDKYRMHIPNTYKPIKGGICWDYCIIETLWFHKNFPSISIETYYYESFIDEETSPTHTFLTFYYNDEWYWFEASWKKYAGIYSFPSKKECLRHVIQLQEDENYKTYKKKPKKTILVKYDAVNKTYDKDDMMEFMRAMRKLTPVKLTSLRSTHATKEAVEDLMVLNNPEDQIEKIMFVKGKSGLNNAVLKLKGETNYSRGRSELLIVRGDKVFLRLKKEGKYNIPGGGWEPEEPHSIAAIREAAEEARILTYEPKYISTYIQSMPKPHDWVLKEVPQKYVWYSYYNELYLAEYKGSYKGHIDKMDQDNNMYKKGKFYPIESVLPILKKPHQDALIEYMNNLNRIKAY